MKIVQFIYKAALMPQCLAAALLLSLTVACDGFVEVDQPNSQLTAPAVFESKATANAAMADVYAQLRENGLISGKLSGVSNLLGNYADELVAYESGAYSSQDFYNNSILASNALVLELWNASYSEIYAANAVYAGVNNSTALATADKNQLLGEALFVRSLVHFYLVNIFGDVPYVKTTDYLQNSTVTRMPVATVYDNILTDLEMAVSLLPDVYLNPDRTRPNKAVAQALQSRVYLYRGDWAQASDMASAVLNNDAVYVWENDLDLIFLKESTSTIWQLAPAYEGRNAEEGSSFVFEAGPPPTVALSDALMAEFETDDQRQAHWTAAVTDGVSVWHHAYKYKQKEDTGTTMECSIVLRVAEQYLIRAEARARQGDLIGAKEDLNKIRNTAGLGNTTAVTATELIDAVVRERRVELFTEQGHRFFDLKRLETLDSVLDVKMGWEATDRLWPLPQLEMQVNPFLRPQNQGY